VSERVSDPFYNCLVLFELLKDYLFENEADFELDLFEIFEF